MILNSLNTMRNVSPAILTLLLALLPQSPGRLTVTALDAVTGLPLGGVQLQLEGQPTRLTNAQGQFVFEELPAGRFRLVAGKDAYRIGRIDQLDAASTGVDLTVRAGATAQITVYLRPAGVVTGQIFSDTGDPVRNAEVVPLRYAFDAYGEILLQHLQGPAASRLPNRKTDDQGRFRIYNLDPGRYGFFVQPPNDSWTPMYYPRELDANDAWIVDVEAGLDTRLNNMVLWRPIAAQGEAAAPAEPGVLVRGRSTAPRITLVLAPDRLMDLQPVLTADANGVFPLARLRSGTYRVRAVQNVPEGSCLRDVRQSDGRNVLLDGFSVLPPEAGFTATIAESRIAVRGKTARGATVALVPDDVHDAGLYRAASADQDGGFELECVFPGEYRLYAWKELEGAGYRNEEFMKDFEDRGIPVTVGDSESVTVNVDAF